MLKVFQHLRDFRGFLFFRCYKSIVNAAKKRYNVHYENISRAALEHSNFLKLWTSESTAVFGITISTVALPLTAILTLNASAGEMGILKALHYAPVLLFGLFIGVWIDRVKRYPLMITAEFGQGILVATIPVAAVLGVLRIELLYLVSFFNGILSAIYILASLSSSHRLLIEKI